MKNLKADDEISTERNGYLKQKLTFQQDERKEVGWNRQKTSRTEGRQSMSAKN